MSFALGFTFQAAFLDPLLGGVGVGHRCAV